MAPLIQTVGISLAAGLLVWFVIAVIRFNLGMPRLWKLLRESGRAERERELRGARTNIGIALYIENKEDYDHPEIQRLKLDLKRKQRQAYLAIGLFFLSLRPPRVG